MRPMRVLFVSKAIVPPYHDGTRCLVRELSTHLRRARATVLTTPGAPPPGPGVEVEPVYRGGAGSFAPALRDNARVLLRLLTGSRHDLWHFVFAPNPPSSTAGRLAMTLRRVPTVQTVASVPRTFDGSPRLLFGRRVVCQSADTRDRLVAAGAPADRLDVIPPPLSPPVVTPDEIAAARRHLGLADDVGSLLVYPGDLEFSGGAAAVARAAPELLAGAPDARLVFACRAKTPRAREVAERLQRELAPLGERVIFAGQVPSLPALLAASRLVLFPVDDLYGKVDLPLSLLEAQSLGVPVVALQKGPLVELEGAIALPSVDRLAAVCLDVLGDDRAWRQHQSAGRAAVARRHDPVAITEAYEQLYDRLLPRGWCPFLPPSL